MYAAIERGDVGLMRRYCHQCRVECFPFAQQQRQCAGCRENCDVCRNVLPQGREIDCKELVVYATSACSACSREFCNAHLMLLMEDAVLCLAGRLPQEKIRQRCHDCMQTV